MSMISKLWVVPDWGNVEGGGGAGEVGGWWLVGDMGGEDGVIVGVC